MRRHDKRNNPRKAHVRHILVPDKPLARKLIEEITSARNPLKLFKNVLKHIQHALVVRKKAI